MAPRTARETRRVWSINVKREEGGFGCLIARGATSTTHGSATALGHWSRSHRRTLPSLRCQPACPGAVVETVDMWTLDGVVIQSSHVQINPKQSGLEMPRFGRAADETGQSILRDWTGQRINGAPHARAGWAGWMTD